MAERIVAAGRHAYDESETAQLASEAVLHRLGESVARLPDAFIAAHPQVAWRDIKRTRNIVAHSYDRVNYAIIWNAMANLLPLEAVRVRKILADLESTD
ncbi:DUF86 domain-containing protein [Nocardia sp. NPDC058497]|uniref:HepT-like ribonuclease domain-containing protein n=1 Tax=Nocardia sp. NPDC058497 TaxID=3346529 RepID=UPI00364CD78C